MTSITTSPPFSPPFLASQRPVSHAARKSRTEWCHLIFVDYCALLSPPLYLPFLPNCQFRLLHSCRMLTRLRCEIEKPGTCFSSLHTSYIIPPPKMEGWFRFSSSWGVMVWLWVFLRVVYISLLPVYHPYRTSKNLMPLLYHTEL